MNDEYTPEERHGNLAHKYQTLRCWILNSIISSKLYDEDWWQDVQRRAEKVLKETE